MSYREKESNYDRQPSTLVEGLREEVFPGAEHIASELRRRITKEDFILVLDCYPGINEDTMLSIAEKLEPRRIIRMADLFKDREAIDAQLRYHLTDDRVFGKMYFGEVMDFIDEDRLKVEKDGLKEHPGLTVIIGFGASLLTQGDLLVCVDLSRWEIQLRYRSGMPNYKAENPDEDILRKYKRAYFIEWRIADKHKASVLTDMDCYIDGNRDESLVMVTKKAFDTAIRANTKQPFRTVPYFDPGVWGGQWMKEVIGLDSDKDNYAWSFDGVPEENSLLFDFEGILLEMPAMNLVMMHPKALLGEQVYARFGAEFPIRFDFLDTMEGQNLSLQVHPVTDYIRKQFGMAYTQDESYYILDARADAGVYLGLKEGVDRKEMLSALEDAQAGGGDFDTDRYINRFPAKKHDHFLIPAGTIHCSAKDVMVLEISATPYIFTFKLWDWERLGLDGKPRPIHLAHGKEVIQWDRTTSWVEENLVDRCVVVDSHEDYTEEHTGLHELEFIETRRFTIRSSAEISCHGSVNVLNLVEGQECLVESLHGEFEPFTVHYAETFIIPEQVGSYRIRTEDGEVRIIQAYVRV